MGSTPPTARRIHYFGTNPKLLKPETDSRDGGGRQDDPDGQLELSDRYQTRSGDPRWAEAVGRIGAAPEVGEIVGEIGRNLEEKRDGHAADRGVEPESRAGSPGCPEPNYDAADGRRQRRRPGRQQPRPPPPREERPHWRRGKSESPGARFHGDAGPSERTLRVATIDAPTGTWRNTDTKHSPKAADHGPVSRSE